MNCGRFEPIFWDESKLHPCEVCHGTAHFVIKPDGYFAVQCESCGSFFGEADSVLLAVLPVKSKKRGEKK